MGALSSAPDLLTLLQVLKNFPQWHDYQAPAANAATSSVQAAAGAGKRIVLLGMVFGIGSTGTAPTGNAVPIRIWDGASGVGNPVFEMDCGCAAVAGQWQYVQLPSGLVVLGSVNTQMVIDTGGGGGANTFQRLSVHGIIVPDAAL